MYAPTGTKWFRSEYCGGSGGRPRTRRDTYVAARERCGVPSVATLGGCLSGERCKGSRYTLGRRTRYIPDSTSTDVQRSGLSAVRRGCRGDAREHCRLSDLPAWRPRTCAQGRALPTPHIRTDRRLAAPPPRRTVAPASIDGGRTYTIITYAPIRYFPRLRHAGCRVNPDSRCCRSATEALLLS